MDATKLVFFEGRLLCRACYKRRWTEGVSAAPGIMVGSGSYDHGGVLSGYGASFTSRLFGHRSHQSERAGRIPTAAELVAAGNKCEDCA